MILMIKLWLEWAEYICVILTLIALIFSFISGSNLLLFSLIIVTLILNIFNRWRSEERTKARISGTLNIQARRFSGELEEIKHRLEMYINEQKKIVVPPKIISNMPKSDDQVIASLQEDVESLHQSLLTVINYLKQENLELRVKNLETLYQTLQTSRHHFSESIPDVQLPDQKVLRKSNHFDLQPTDKMAWKCIHLINAHDDSVTDLKMTNDNQYLFSTSWDKYLKIWSLELGQEVSQVIASEQGITTLAIDQNNYFNETIATGSLEGEIKIWSLNEKSLQLSLKQSLLEHTGSIHGLAVDSSNNMIISAGFDAYLKQWDLSNGHLLYDIDHHHDSINAIAINEEIGLIIIAGEDGLISMWELGGEKQLGILMGNSTAVECLMISQSGQFIVAGCVDGTIKIWQLPITTFSVFLEVTPELELNAHNGQVMDLLFTSDEQLLYSGGVDGLIKIWHFTTAQEIGYLKITDDDRISSLALSHDEQILIAGSANGIIKIWQQSQT